MIFCFFLVLGNVYSQEEWNTDNCQNDINACMQGDIEVAFETDPKHVINEDPTLIFEKNPEAAIEYLEENPGEFANNDELLGLAYENDAGSVLDLLDNEMANGNLIDEINSNDEVKKAWFAEKGVDDKGAQIQAYDGVRIKTLKADFNPDDYGVGVKLTVLESGKLVVEGDGVIGRIEIEGEVEKNINGEFFVRSGMLDVHGNVEGSIYIVDGNSEVIINGVKYNSNDDIRVSTVNNMVTVRGENVEMYYNYEKLGEFSGIVGADSKNNIYLSLGSQKTEFKRFFNGNHLRTYITYDETEISNNKCSYSNCIVEKNSEILVHSNSDKGYEILLHTNEILLVTKGVISGFGLVKILSRNPYEEFGDYILTNEGIYHKNSLNGFSNVDIVGEYDDNVHVFIGGKESRRTFLINDNIDDNIKNEIIKFLRIETDEFEKLDYSKTSLSSTEYVKDLMSQLGVRDDYEFRKELFEVLKAEKGYDYKGNDLENSKLFPDLIQAFSNDLKLSLGVGSSYENVVLPDAIKAGRECSEGNICNVGDAKYDTKVAVKSRVLYYCASDGECFVPSGEEGLRVVEHDGELFYVVAPSGSINCNFKYYSDISNNCGVVAMDNGFFDTSNIDKSSIKGWDDMSQSVGYLADIYGAGTEKFDDKTTLFRKGGFKEVSGSMCMKVQRLIAEENGVELPGPEEGVVDAWQLSKHSKAILAEDMSKGFDLREEIDNGRLKKGYVLIVYEPKSKYNPPLSDSPVDGQSRDASWITSEKCSNDGQCGTHVMMYAGNDKQGNPRFIHQYGSKFYVEESGPNAGWTIDKITKEYKQIPRGIFPTY